MVELVPLVTTLFEEGEDDTGMSDEVKCEAQFQNSTKLGDILFSFSCIYCLI
jgi:hypothetical protein